MSTPRLDMDQSIKNKMFDYLVTLLNCTHTSDAPYPAPYTALQRAVSTYNIRMRPFVIDGFSLTIMMDFQFYLKI